MRHLLSTAIVFSVITALFTTWAECPVVADTTFDCSRFNLKYNPRTGERKCVDAREASSIRVPGQSRTGSSPNSQSLELRSEQTQAGE